MKLRSNIEKCDALGLHRERTVEQTWNTISGYLEKAGITRIADITHLDRIGIPVYNAIVPCSSDVISVYNGKGPTPLHAKTSAVMEAIERYASWLPQSADENGSYNDLVKKYGDDRVLNPKVVNYALNPMYNNSLSILWVWGYDLISQTEVLVPHYLAGYYKDYCGMPIYALSTTNGIASGNSIEEAVCHALFELIERDDWTMAEIISNRLSSAVRAGTLGAKPSISTSEHFQDIHPNINPDTLPKKAKEYYDAFVEAGVSVVIKDISGDSGLATILAASYEDLGDTVSMMHQGFGCHPNPEVACIRALTEAAQSRVVDIQAMREDITLSKEVVPKWASHSKRSSAFNPEAWVNRRSSKLKDFKDLPGIVSSDIIIDLNSAVTGLQKIGLNQAIVIDRTPPGIPASVAKVIVPGIECWALDRSKLGSRANQCWQNGVKTLFEIGYLSN